MVRATFDKTRSVLQVELAGRSVVRALLLGVIFVGVLSAIAHIRHALLLIGAAFFLALALNAPVHWLGNHLPGRRKDGRTLATIIAFTLVVGVLVGFAASLVPPVVRQGGHFVAAAPSLIHEAEQQHNLVGRFAAKYKLQDEISRTAKQLTSHFDQTSSRAFGYLSQVAGNAIAILTILVMTFMMLLEGPYWLRIAEDLLPEDKRAPAKRIAREMYKVVKGYVNGQVILAVIAAIVVFPVLLVLHIDYPIALAGVVLICGLIPLVGHIIGTVIIGLVALIHSLFAAVAIVAYYVLYQQVENYIIRPHIQASATNLSPLVVFAAAIIGVEFGGLFGALVAIPIAGCARILLGEYLRHRKAA